MSHRPEPRRSPRSTICSRTGELANYDGAGYLIMHEAPERTAQDVIDFLTRNGTG